MKNFRMLIVGCMLTTVAGMQAAQPARAAASDNGSFMSLWSNYSNCQTTTDIEQLRASASTLTKAANRSPIQGGFVLPLPGNLEQFVSVPTARFAVDVKAMAAACSLRASYAAMEVGKLDVAKDLLRTILSYQPQSEYAYYTLQAKALLLKIETNVIEVTLNLP
jgi:hypothetical protein